MNVDQRGETQKPEVLIYCSGLFKQRSNERAGPGVCEGDGQAECVGPGGTQGFPTLDMLRII